MGPGPEKVVEGPVSYCELPPPEEVCPSRGTSGTKVTAGIKPPCSLKEDVSMNNVTLGVGLTLAPQEERPTTATGGPSRCTYVIDTSRLESLPHIEVNTNTSSHLKRRTGLPPLGTDAQTHTTLEKGKSKAPNAYNFATAKRTQVVDESTNIFERRVPKPKEDTIIQNGRTYRKFPSKTDIKLTGKQMRDRRLLKKTQKEISERKQSRIDTHYEHHTIRQSKKKRLYITSDIGNILRHTDQPPADTEGPPTTQSGIPNNQSVAPSQDANTHPTHDLREVNSGMLTTNALVTKLKTKTATSSRNKGKTSSRSHKVNHTSGQNDMSSQTSDASSATGQQNQGSTQTQSTASTAGKSNRPSYASV
ncbi:uncharacterized protein MELLADRAFT_90076 [Melampsora larici-populina 98AG31]|uniref:Uncharacterized protein n=1 Tax=Melampsora larici-populina (strain 98AG31 / pathotype 3-4-7) TaxID=747676 RepID=F4RVL6_MELLP|nr:uncharacterized protein MELLADRAFT_90076 [Melampsora larici-populina 98AG31]EGG03648.1 hypothetical protein MELLADRAFT_90076 [Melampsora larici-populina 98AG31]